MHHRRRPTPWPPPPRHRRVIAATPDYRPQDDGYLVLIEPADVDRILDDLDMPYRLSEVPFEGVTMVDGCFHAVYLATLVETNHGSGFGT